MSIRGNMPFRDYKMSSKGHLRTLVQTQFKIATRVFEDERVDFSPTTTRIQKLQGKKTREIKYFLAGIFLVFIHIASTYIVQFNIHILKIFSISVFHSLRDFLLFISGTIEARPFLVFEMGNAEGGSVKYRRLCSSIMCI